MTRDDALADEQLDDVLETIVERETVGEALKDDRDEGVFSDVRVRTIDADTDGLGLTVGDNVPEREFKALCDWRTVMEGEVDDDAGADCVRVPFTDADKEGEVDGDTDTDTDVVLDGLAVDVGVADGTADSLDMPEMDVSDERVVDIVEVNDGDVDDVNDAVMEPDMVLAVEAV